MPRSTQIIPSYDVSHVMTVINDNSVVDTITDVVSAEPNVRFLCFFESAKGPDGVHTLTSTKDYIRMYGQPNFKKYGQPGYMPYLLLNTGYAKVHCIRVVPSDAQFANIVIYANVTTDADTHKVTVNYTAEALATGGTAIKLTDLSLFESSVEATATETKIPLMAIACLGRGQYGNNLTIRLTSDTVSDINNAYKNYRLEVLSTESGLSTEEIYRGTLTPSGISGTSTLFLSDKVNDPTTGSKLIKMYINEEGLDTLYDAYSAQVDAANEAATGEDVITKVSFNEFDFIFGTDKTLTSYTNYGIAEGSLNFEATTGTGLLNGGDGYIGADGNPLPETATDDTPNRRDAVIEEYKKAMFIGTDEAFVAGGTWKYPNGGETSRRYGCVASSKRRIPTDIILDAGFPDEVKAALYALSLKRTDAKLYLDAGRVNTSNGLVDWKTTFNGLVYNTTSTSPINAENVGMYDFIPTHESAWYKTRDPFTNKIIDVTYTWSMAKKLPGHIINNGNQTPFVGEEYTLIDDAIPGSVRPIIDADDLVTKDKLFKLKLNTIDSLTENKYIRATQVTAQNRTSDLSEDSNALVILEMKRMLEDLVLAKTYRFSSAEDRVRFTEDATRLFDTYPNRKVNTFAIRFDMNEFERERNILHCYLEVVFRQIATTGIIEIDINKRTS